MTKNNKRLQEIFDKYVNSRATEGEIGELWDYVDDPLYASEIDYLLGVDYNRSHDELGLSEGQKVQMLQSIFAKEHRSGTIKKLWIKIAVAASLLMVVSIGINYLRRNSSPKQVAYTQDIPAGKKGATLILANGQKIMIKDALEGRLAIQSGVKISKNAAGQIVYEVSTNDVDAIGYNTLSTTRGEEAQVRLPDGTLIFLNSASSLVYPASFSKQEKREVSLTGEAYFEVHKDKNHPFIVKSKGQNVEVLGTHFNINAYPNEVSVKTTLLEGSVKVNDRILKPDEQSILSKENLDIREIDAEEVVSWKNGMFLFDDESLNSIMRKIERWYDVEVVFEPNVDQNKLYGGGVSRYDSVSKVLEKLAMAGKINFKIEGRRIVVMK